MPPVLPSGTVTFLFTDVEGSTRLLHELGAEGYGAALVEHRRVIRDACSREGGVEVDTQGDAFFFAFPSAPGALAAADGFTQALASGPIQVRVGLHTGTPLLIEEGYVGDDVHFAARVAATSHGGQVVLSAATAALVEPALTDLGDHRLKDIEAAVPIYQLGEGSFPPLKTISNTNLPRPASSFVGREDELRAVLGRIESGARLVTLTGPGGTGKTRLALEAAATLVPKYTAGVFWVGLASLRDPALVTETIAQTLGAKDGLAEHVAERELLLLLDNLEQVIEVAPELGDLLRSCPNLTLLVTSRELLRVQGEVEYAVPPLAEPEAVALFCERSQLEPSEEIAELCARLDSLPLAVELAAARTKALTVTQIAERLARRLDLLKGGRDADPRQQTLRATIEWSNELLSPDEQVLFARLSVFSGGCSLEAAEGVAGADLDTLQSLVEKSLLRFSNGRYRMLETVREFATERLADSGTAVDVAQRHLEYYLAVAQKIPERWELRNVDTNRINPERDNLRGALDTALALQPALATELAGRLAAYWVEQGHFHEARASLAAALDADPGGSAPARARALRAFGAFAYKQSDFTQAEQLLRQALALDRSHSALRGVGADLNLLGNVSLGRGDVDQADGLFNESVAAYDEAGEEAGRLGPLGNLAMIARRRGDYARSIALDQHVAAAARGRFHYLLSHSLNGLGLALEATGKTEDARQAFEECLLVSSSHGFLEAQANALANLAHLERPLEPSSALVHYRQSIELMRELQDRRGIPECLEGLAAISSGDAVRAATLLGAATGIRQGTGAPPGPTGSEIDSTIQWATQTLGSEDFDVAWSSGSGMSLDEAVEYALSDTD